jgi:phenylalanyl-tRNA synthetase alpha chain
MPSRRRWTGAVHPVGGHRRDREIFRGLGFAIALGPRSRPTGTTSSRSTSPPITRRWTCTTRCISEVPPTVDEPGAGRLLLRTHTSPVQIRVMHASEPPIRVIMPGMVYRSDAFDPSHAPAFEQIEGLAIDEGVSFVDLKATLTHFARRFFSPSTAVRFRPSFFPFTEPSAEMDVECQLCHGSGCGACKGTGWMEILGCGMVHRACSSRAASTRSATPASPSAWVPARITMLRHGVPDIRLLYEGDMRFLSQFTAARSSTGGDT